MGAQKSDGSFLPLSLWKRVKAATDTKHIENELQWVLQKLVDAHLGSERLKTYGVTPSRFKSSNSEDFCILCASASGLAMK
jgi:hypothetical protein